MFRILLCVLLFSVPAAPAADKLLKLEGDKCTIKVGTKLRISVASGNSEGEFKITGGEAKVVSQNWIVGFAGMIQAPGLTFDEIVIEGSKVGDVVITHTGGVPGKKVTKYIITVIE